MRTSQVNVGPQVSRPEPPLNSWLNSSADQPKVPSIENVILALSITYWPFWARLVFAETRSLKGMRIGYDRVKSLYFENPSFGFYLLRLTSARLFQNIATLEVTLEERNHEIQHLRRGISRTCRARDESSIASL